MPILDFKKSPKYKDNETYQSWIDAKKQFESLPEFDKQIIRGRITKNTQDFSYPRELEEYFLRDFGRSLSDLVVSQDGSGSISWKKPWFKVWGDNDSIDLSKLSRQQLLTLYAGINGRKNLFLNTEGRNQYKSQGKEFEAPTPKGFTKTGSYLAAGLSGNPMIGGRGAINSPHLDPEYLRQLDAYENNVYVHQYNKHGQPAINLIDSELKKRELPEEKSENKNKGRPVRIIKNADPEKVLNDDTRKKNLTGTIDTIYSEIPEEEGNAGELQRAHASKVLKTLPETQEKDEKEEK